MLDAAALLRFCKTILLLENTSTWIQIHAHYKHLPTTNKLRNSYRTKGLEELMMQITVDDFMIFTIVRSATKGVGHPRSLGTIIS